MTNKPSKDDRDLVAAALGLKSSAWAKAVIHLEKPEFNAAINGEQVLKDGKPVMKGQGDNTQLSPNDYLDMPFSMLPPSLQRTFKNIPGHLWFNPDDASRIVEAWLKAGEVELTQAQVFGQ